MSTEKQTATQRLLAQMRDKRKRWVELGDGRAVQVIRPTEVELARHFLRGGRVVVEPEVLVQFTCDWRGFTEADLLGAAVGSEDAVPFHQDLWAEVVSDKSEWLNKAASALIELMTEHLATVEAEAKN